MGRFAPLAVTVAGLVLARGGCGDAGDVLSAEAETNSAYERFGASCAGRVSANTDRGCTELLS